MSEKRFELTEINPSVNPLDTVYFIIDYENPSKNIRNLKDCVDLLNEQQATINELQSIINHIKCEENCEDYDYCCETVCSLSNEIKHLKEENEQLKNKLNKDL